MPHFNGPFMVTGVDTKHSTMTLDIPNQPHIFNKFHMSQVIPFVENDKDLFPSHELTKSPPIILEGEEEFFINCILNERKRGRGTQYLVHWMGYGPEDDQWLPSRELEDCEALDIWQAWQKAT
jgi:hypothetical protein